jgi:hypothetical protein
MKRFLDTASPLRASIGSWEPLNGAKSSLVRFILKKQTAARWPFKKYAHILAEEREHYGHEPLILFEDEGASITEQ